MLSLRIKKCHCPLIHHWLNWVKSSCLTLKLFRVTDYHTCLWETLNELSVWEVSKCFSIHNRKTKKLGYFSQYSENVPKFNSWRTILFLCVLGGENYLLITSEPANQRARKEIIIFPIFTNGLYSCCIIFFSRKITWNPEDGCCFFVRKLRTH